MKVVRLFLSGIFHYKLKEKSDFIGRGPKML